jgi:hypothetical protein
MKTLVLIVLCVLLSVSIGVCEAAQPIWSNSILSDGWKVQKTISVINDGMKLEYRGNFIIHFKEDIFPNNLFRTYVDNVQIPWSWCPYVKNNTTSGFYPEDKIDRLIEAMKKGKVLKIEVVDRKNKLLYYIQFPLTGFSKSFAWCSDNTDKVAQIIDKQNQKIEQRNKEDVEHKKTVDFAIGLILIIPLCLFVIAVISSLKNGFVVFWWS